jgi:hypothetical protein
MQGSLPKPVILYDEQGAFPMLPFETDTLLTHYHVVEISKPGIPLLADTKTSTPDYAYLDPKTQQVPLAYCQPNYLDYYVARDAAVLRYLARQPWVQANDITAMGHSQQRGSAPGAQAGPLAPGGIPQRQSAGPHAHRYCRQPPRG